MYLLTVQFHFLLLERVVGGLLGWAGDFVALLVHKLLLILAD